MDNRTMLSALAWEARRRGIGYGALAAALRDGEQEKILRAYRREEAVRQRAREERTLSRQPEAKPYQARRLNTQEAALLLAQGLPDREIARRLGVTAKTIRGWKSRTGRG